MYEKIFPNQPPDIEMVSLPTLVVLIAASLSLEMLSTPWLESRGAAAQSHFKFPDTPAAKQLQAWLAAFESGDRAIIQGFAGTIAAAEPLVDRNGIANFKFACSIHLLDDEYIIPVQPGKFAHHAIRYRRRQTPLKGMAPGHALRVHRTVRE